MSDKLQNSNTGLGKTNSKLIGSKLGQGLMSGHLGALGKIELPRMFNQLVIFLLDGSGSMTYPGATGKSKGQEVHQAVINVLERLNASKNKSSFDVAFWGFANETIEMFPVQPIKYYNLTKDCFNPCEYITDYTKTNLNEVLSYVKTQTDTYLQKHEGQNTKVLVIILGDGAINDYKSALELKEELGNNPLINFSSILFESPTWDDQYDANSINNIKKEFSKLASTDADYMSTVDPEKIRNHMIQSITKVSNI